MNPSEKQPKFDLQAAIDRFPPEGGTVLIPPGVHYIDVPLELRGSNVRLKGAGGSGAEIDDVSIEDRNED